MNTHRILKCQHVLVMTACILFWGVVQALAQSHEEVNRAREEQQKPAAQRRAEARARIEALQAGLAPEVANEAEPPPPLMQDLALTLPSGQNPLVDLLLPHYANSPNMRKFVDVLPGLGAPLATGANYIPVAFPDTTTYPGTDYYVIALVAFSQKMNTDLPASELRGYVQLETPVVAAAMAAAGTPSKHILLTYPGGAPIMYQGVQAVGTDSPLYLGGTIVASRHKPVRIKFVNLLPAGNAGNLPFPVDMGVMGAGMGPVAGQNFTQNRATLHLHGGRTPWISDGTPHQWTVPVGETSVYQKGVSATDVPDMPASGQGELTFYWTNEQSARLLFYHDHAWGITRLNVYAGEAAGFLIHDQVEDDLIDGTNVSGVFTAAGMAPTPILPNQAGLGAQYRYGVPLVIQDKTWVNDATTPPGAGFAATGATPTPYTATVDPLWNTYVPTTHGGNLWWPHEYVVNENIYDPSGITVMGRWDYGPWMNPPMMVQNPVLPTPTITPESFMDTVIVNGCAFPTVTVPPIPIRFRILSVCNDRTINLSLFYAEPLSTRIVTRGSGFTAPVVTFSAPPAGVTATGTATLTQGVSSTFTITNPGSGYTIAPAVTIDRAPGDTTGYGAAATATIAGGAVTAITLTDPGVNYTLAPIVTIDPPPAGTTALATAALTGEVGSIIVTNPGSGYTTAPTVLITDGGAGTGATAVASLNTEVKMVPASPIPAFPTWPVDGRPGGVPDPATSGPPWILIGNEGGFLANVDVVPPQPVDFDYCRKNVTFGGVTSKSLLLNPAIRADVIVDFSSAAGKTLIVYNDCPAPMPLYDVRYDYFTDDPDQSSSGGAPTTPLGFGPNTRTIMQINVAAAGATPYNLTQLQTVLPKAFQVGQDPIVVPESAYNAAYNANYPDIFANVTTEALNTTGAAQPVSRVLAMLPGAGYTTAPTVSFASSVGSGAAASAGLNPIGGITLVTAGSGYTTPPAVTIGPPALALTPLPLAVGGTVQGIQATAVATISGGVVTAITVTEPGAGYTNIVTAPTITIAAPTGGVAATATVTLPTLGTVGSIVVTAGGSGYLASPQVFLTGGGGMGAQATAMLAGSMVPTYKNITEGFDPDYGRMFVQLGSTPNPLTPSIGAGATVGISKYIDPPSEFLTPETPVLWRITHLGVDSHALHFHLFDVQVINRVDWADIIKPPYPEEVGWKDTIRTNPFEDILIALKPTVAAMKLPFGVPNSVRLLDPSTVAGSTANFNPIPALPGVPAVAQITNVMTNFFWEYVFHCHLLGHEEMDMMRPVCFQVPSTVPAAPVLTATGTGGAHLSWTDATPFNYTTWTPTSTLGNPANEVGFRIMRRTGTTGAFTQIGTAPANSTTYLDNTAGGRSYSYQVVAWNAAGSATSNTVSLTVTATPPAAPTSLTGTVATIAGNNRNDLATLTFTNNATNETSFTLQRARDAAFTTNLNTTTWNSTVAAGATVTRTQNVRKGFTYYWRVRANNGGGSSAWSNVFSAAAP